MTTTDTPTLDTGTAPAAEASTEVGSVFVSNYPPFSFWNQDGLDAYHAALDRPPGVAPKGRNEDVAPKGRHETQGTPLGLYLHLPFCRQRCKFCYYRVFVDKNADQIQTYLDTLAGEVEAYAKKPAVIGRPLSFVYFGGGTPSYVAVKHLHKLIARIKAAMPWDDVQEVTFECEPGTLTQSKVAAYREIGVTRLSLGIENWSDEILRENGRAHLSGEIDRCLPWIREQGFYQLNVDLIAGMVGETWGSWRRTVQKTIDTGPDSVTIYQMELPYNTVYSQGILEGGASPVADWQTKREWHLHAIEELERAGYEVSSAYTMLKRRAAADGKARFAYRDSLWHGADMLGTGVASFGHLGGIHAQNVSGWGDYLGKVADGELPLGRAFVTTDGERATRELILQMKLGRLDLDYFRRKFDFDPLARWQGAFDRLADREMLAVKGGDEVQLTRQGLLQVDSLLPEFYDEKYRNARYT